MKSFVIVLVNIILVSASPLTSSGRDEAIVGGHDIEISEAPHQIYLFYGGSFHCGGSIIDKDLIITAAHCVTNLSPKRYMVRVGSSNLKNGYLAKVKNVTRHEKFDSHLDYDVGLIRLQEPLQFNENVSAVPLAEKDATLKAGDMTFVTGMGTISSGGPLPKQLQGVEVPIVDFETCKKQNEIITVVTPRMLCAGLDEGGKDSCQGDSGGPLVHKGKLYGLVSWGYLCAEPHYPGVYANVAALRDWIDENSKVV